MVNFKMIHYFLIDLMLIYSTSTKFVQLELKHSGIPFMTVQFLSSTSTLKKFYVFTEIKIKV